MSAKHIKVPASQKGKKPSSFEFKATEAHRRWLWFAWSWVKGISLVAALTLATLSLGRPWKALPALGPLLDPYHGIWAHRNSEFESAGAPRHLAITGLKEAVEVQVDQDQIKHVFAANDEDLYFAQGYLVASDRLWQMDFISRVASGRLSEVMGRKALKFDRLFVKLGIPQAAKQSAFLMEQDPVTGPALRAYTRGVNAFIKNLGSYDLPFEFKLLGYEPERWTPYKSALLMKFMAYNLSGHSLDLPLTRSQSRISGDDFRELFSLRLWNPEPIVPEGTEWNFPSRSEAAPKIPYQVDLQKLEPMPTPHPSNGSNNWAVTGKKSTTGLPILSNDIHLGFALPSLWYQIQLVSPSQNVYGVTLPGAPGVILGFNEKIGWAVTNGEDDVLDWYQLRFRDEKRSEYLYDGDWRPVISRETLIKIKGEAPEKLILRQTHFGPIVYDETEEPASRLIPRGLAMRWAALDPSNELKTFLLLNRASSTEGCHRALESFDTPSQNFLCADNQNDVGLWHMGKVPIRWMGQGRLISDGASSVYEWKGWIPHDELPSVRNPERGYLSSANQEPADGRYPHYLGWSFESPFRAMRINEILKSKSKFTPEEIVRMQGDTLSIPARMTLPNLMKALKDAPLNPVETKARDLLSKWDHRFEEDSGAAAIYYAWFKAIERRLWSGMFPEEGTYLYPPLEKTVSILADEPTSKWFDNPLTESHETLTEVARSSFTSAVKDVQEVTAEHRPERWTWASFRKTEFPHIGQIPGLGHAPLKARGMEHTIFANHGGHGPVWKLVVAMGRSKPSAWGIYPGGQSGDPTSAHYDDFMEEWRVGHLKELVYLKSAQEQSPRLQRQWRLEAPK